MVKNPKKITIALAGNANVGKSVIFNQLTGLHQHIGNWPGKTIEKVEGTLHYKNYTIDILDLPGIYSLSTFSIEELVSRDYIATEKPDIVINVVDASVLERNLFFTIQLLELKTPLIIALNQMDLAREKGIVIDTDKLETLLGVPVVSTIAIKGTGIHELLEKSIAVIEGRQKIRSVKLEYGAEIESRIAKLALLLEKVDFVYPSRWGAIKLLEGDETIEKMILAKNRTIVYGAKILAEELERIHAEPCSTIVSAARYELVNKIVRETQRVLPGEKPRLADKLDSLTTHKFWGYMIMLAVMLTIFYLIFTAGGYLSTKLTAALEFLHQWSMEDPGIIFVWSGIIEGVVAGVTIVLPYIIPFYILLAVLEDTGYLARIAFLMDSAMHKIGLHGKAFIPLILGYGCTVPACLGCRIMETDRERLIAGFVVTLVPCAARTVVILGLVGIFVGIEWALTLYVIDLMIIFILGRIAFKVLPGEPMGLIMEMPSYKKPTLHLILKQAWNRTKDFIYIAFPLIIVGNLIIKILEFYGALEIIGELLSPILVLWLGLPAVAGIAFMLGVLRKELTVVMLATLIGTTNIGSVLTPIQIIVFALVTMLYIPCIATIAALAREFGWVKALTITIFEILFAIFIGGIMYRVLTVVM
jgi:ferrous iron transport protein B